MRMKNLLLAGLVPAAAFTYGFGGWAVTTVEDVPEYAVTGKPFDLTYTVRQHGFSLLTRLSGCVTVSAGADSRSFATTELGEGMYRAQVTLPAAGTWTVRIENGFIPKSGTTFRVRAVAPAAATPAMQPTDRGEQLFAAKGCATCHTHQLVKDLTSVKAGPDLSEPKFSSAYLARFLANPNVKTDWKTTARMPNLGLESAEIAALSAFLTK